MTAANDATRYLCAAAHLDPDFQDKVITLLVKEKHRAICPALGVNMALVINHCLAAKNRRRLRDFGLVLVFFLGVVFSLLFESPVPFLLSLPIFWIIIVAELWDIYSLLSNNLLNFKFDPDCIPSRVDDDLRKELELVENGNVVVYSGFSPFVGSGIGLGGWSFSLNVNKGEEELGKLVEPEPFEINELYSYVSKSLDELCLDRLSIEDKLFVNGKDIREDRRFLPDILLRPVARVDQQVIDSFVGNPTHVVRHYKCIRITDWKEELILSIFLRFSKTGGGSFFAEASYSLLTPISEVYRGLDRLSHELTGAKIALSSTSLAAALWFFGWLVVIARMLNTLSQNFTARKIEKFIKNTCVFDYGASASMREHVSSWEYRRYFQKLDKEMYLKTIEREILESITQFFEAKGIDTSGLKERQTTILNSGVIVTGGEVKAHSLAVGQQSLAVGSRLVKVVSTVAGGTINK